MSNKSAVRLITQAKLYAYQLPFRTNMHFKNHCLDKREGLILQLTDRQGEHYFSEIAPLPGFSHETLEQAQTQIMTLLSQGINHLQQYRHGYPSVQFALDYLYPANITSADTEIDKVPLLQGNNTQIVKQYLQLTKPSLIKLKVARQAVNEDITLFQQLCALNPSLEIRCDANQTWKSAQADYFFTHINLQQLDYIEEPTDNHQANLYLAKKHRLFLALDETLQAENFIYQHDNAIKALVIKPTLIGSKAKIDQLVLVAKKHQLQVSISASFESVVGLLQLQHIAADISRQLPISLGIDTLKYFKNTLLTDRQNIAQHCQQLECLWDSH